MYDFRDSIYIYTGVLRIALRISAKQRQDDGLPVLQPALRERGEQVDPEARELAGTRGREAALAERLLERVGTFEASQHSLCHNRSSSTIKANTVLYDYEYANLLSTHKSHTRNTSDVRDKKIEEIVITRQYLLVIVRV